MLKVECFSNRLIFVKINVDDIIVIVYMLKKDSDDDEIGKMNDMISEMLH